MVTRDLCLLISRRARIASYFRIAHTTDLHALDLPYQACSPLPTGAAIVIRAAVY